MHLKNIIGRGLTVLMFKKSTLDEVHSLEHGLKDAA